MSLLYNAVSENRVVLSDITMSDTVHNGLCRKYCPFRIHCLLLLKPYYPPSAVPNIYSALGVLMGHTLGTASVAGVRVR